jgi:hypothetical protein
MTGFRKKPLLLTIELGEVPSANSRRPERQSAPVLHPAAAAVSLSAPVSEVTFSTECTGTGADFDRSFSCCI